MTGTFILRRDSKPNEWGEKPIYIQYSTGGVMAKAATGLRVNPKDWDPTGGNCNRWVRPGNPRYNDINTQLFKIKKRIDDTIATFEDERTITIPVLRSILNGSYAEEVEEGKGKVGFVDRVLEYNHGLYRAERIGFSVWYNVQVNMGNFKRFLNEIGRDTNESNKLMCRDVDEDIIFMYINWRKSRGNTNETINKTLTPIFKTLEDCCRKGWISRERYESISKLYLPKSSRLTDIPEDDIHYLTKEQVRKLMDTVEKCKYSRTKEFLDMFLFSVHTCGLRFSDVATLKWDNIDMEKRMLKKFMVKGHTRMNTLLTVPLSDESMRILEKWRGKHDTYVFGLLPDDFDLSDAGALNKILNCKNRTINTSLAAMGDKIKLPFRLHFHVSRHTWATLSLNAGVDVKIISSMMGHSSVLVTEKVYSRFMPETLQMTMDQRLNFAI